MKKILVTDTLFIFDDHEAKLREAGFEIERLSNPKATEAELIEAVKGKTGYILGGIERITDPVIEAGTDLKAIVFTGADIYSYVPGHELATKRGILLAGTPSANSYAVAEYTVMLTLLMLRRGLELGRAGNESFKTTQSLQDAHVGIVGLGRIGENVARMLKGMGTYRVSYFNRTRKTDLESGIGIDFLGSKELFSTCDVILDHLSSEAGEFITKELLMSTKKDVIFVCTGADNSFNKDTLYDLLQSNKARAAFDLHGTAPDDRYRELPIYKCYYSNENAAYNTHAANRIASDMATESIINILIKGIDRHVVNA